MLCMVAYKVYHALRLDYRADIDLAISRADFSCIHDRAAELIVLLIRQFNLRKYTTQAGVPSAAATI